MNTSGRVKAAAVRDIFNAKRTEFKRTASVLRAQLDSQITEAASQGSGFVVIEVPRYCIGREPYDWVQMGKALVEQLVEDGYYVTGTYVRFRVTWDAPVKKPKPTGITIPILGARR